MNFFQHPICNTVLRPPAGATIEECRVLPIWRSESQGGQPFVMSFWKPDADELKALNAGGCVTLHVNGHTHPPVYIGVVE